MTRAVKKQRNTKQSIDGLANVLSGRGESGTSKTGSNYYLGTELSYGILSDIHRSGGVGSRYLTLKPEDATSKPFIIDGHTKDTPLINKLHKLQVRQKIKELLVWDRVFGGAVMLLMCKDGSKSLTKPLNINRLSDIVELRVFPAGKCNDVSIAERTANKMYGNFGEPEIYQITNQHGGHFRVHKSRLIVTTGSMVENSVRRVNNGWGDSAIQKVYDSLMSLFSHMLSGEQVLEEMVIGVLKMEDLNVLVSTDDGKASVRERVRLVDTTKSIERSIVVDINEEYQRFTANLSGVEKIQQNAMLLLTGAGGYPATRLFGRSPQGENATGESDERQYYDDIATMQNEQVEPHIRHIIKLLSYTPEFSDIDAETITIEFETMYSPSHTDAASAFDKTIDALMKMIDKGVMTNENVAEVVPQIVSKYNILGIKNIKADPHEIENKQQEGNNANTQNNTMPKM